jgi:hypothetical protein
MEKNNKSFPLIGPFCDSPGGGTEMATKPFRCMGLLSFRINATEKLSTGWRGSPQLQ